MGYFFPLTTTIESDTHFMAKLSGRSLVEEQLLKLAPGVSDRSREAYERSEIGARRFAKAVRWSVEPRVHIAKNGHVTLRFIEIGVSMTALIFLDHNTIDYRASIGREGVDFAPYCQGIDLMINTLEILEAFGIKVFTYQKGK